ncbi:hypothetical protein [Hyphomicrobium sp. LHD-15]|uniref:hypothetical protein n=1 Tax=Hyphomicrobium sp. LHD-15 TaxID=3072142 RepID=UPI00280CD4C8|nr:hypothetical protein [Hyphomicrobium sp. LHD-15]MDQ8698007.1 hypothetical protein [Hyphomicrobium sp. LHD-15]
MATSAKLERSVLSHEEFALVKDTHHPEIYGVGDLKALQELQSRLRTLRGKERTLTRQKRRETRGKSEARGKSFPGTSEQPLKRKQVFAAALKRVNNEVRRVRAIEATARNVEAAHKAFQLKREANFLHHPVERTASDGMKSLSNTRRRSHIPGSQIGSVSQATKVAQAIKDSRPS